MDAATFDCVFPLLLFLSVLRQFRGKHLTLCQLVWPLALVIWAALKYPHGIPSSTAGLGLGVGAGLSTRVFRRGDGALIAKATLARTRGARTRSSCCGEFVFVNQAAEQIAPVHLTRVRRRDRCDG